tara:strand:+ start:1154 stop:1597 length:444 start_codon:yes stop_codon:yes gene_type:complete
MNKQTIEEHFLTNLLPNKYFVKEIKSTPQNPVGNKLIGEDSSDYKDAFLTSNMEEINDNILHKYNTLRTNDNQDIDTNDSLNKKEIMLNMWPLPDKTGIPDFASFAEKLYGKSNMGRADKAKRGFFQKSDYRDLQRINYDPANIVLK